MSFLMQNILNITLNNKLKNLVLLSLSPKPANTGLSFTVPMTIIISEAKETSFLWQLSWNQICCKEQNNFYLGLSTRRNTGTKHTYMKSRIFLYTSNNHKENTIKTFTTATSPMSDFIEDSSQDSDYSRVPQAPSSGFTVECFHPTQPLPSQVEPGPRLSSATALRQLITDKRPPLPLSQQLSNAFEPQNGPFLASFLSQLYLHKV